MRLQGGDDAVELLAGVDGSADDPSMLADQTVPGEPEPLVGGERAAVQEASGHRAGVLGVALDDASAKNGDELQRTGQCRGRHP